MKTQLMMQRRSGLANAKTNVEKKITIRRASALEPIQHKIVSLVRELREERMRIDVMKQKLTQCKLWLRYLKGMGMQCPDFCDLILIMINIPLTVDGLNKRSVILIKYIERN